MAFECPVPTANSRATLPTAFIGLSFAKEEIASFNGPRAYRPQKVTGNLGVSQKRKVKSP